jgi:protein-tyrosine phosphatase
MKILFVCHGNICRSPLAEGLFARMAREEGLDAEVDSAGIISYHRGELPDPRSIACARDHGLELSHRSRPVTTDDFHTFNLLIAMDQANVADLKRKAPAGTAGKIRLMRDWDPAGAGEVPDPYFGGAADFEYVWHLCERSMPGLLRELERTK